MSKISELLAQERTKALQAIQKHSTNTASSDSHDDKENRRANCINSTGAIKKVPKQKQDSGIKSTNTVIDCEYDNKKLRPPIDYNKSNITYDEVTLFSESVNSFNNSPQPALANSYAKQQLSFEPGEMTGRSTLYGKDKKRLKPVTSTDAPKKLSVDEILSNCFSEKARELRKSLNVYNQDASSRCSSSMNSFQNASNFSLPRTADLSFMSLQGSLRSNESFAPADLMKSQLLHDEISWDQKFSKIPKVALSDEAKEKANDDPESQKLEESLMINPLGSFNPNASEFSRFFATRSAALHEMVISKSPEKSRKPVKLIRDDTVSTTTTTSQDEQSDISLGGSFYKPSNVIPNHTYKILDKNKISYDSSKDSIELSLSAVNCALESIDLDDSGAGDAINKLLQNAKSQKKITNEKIAKQHIKDKNPKEKDDEMSFAQHLQQQENERFSAMAELVLDNKENIDPHSVPAVKLNDTTLSFTESLLNAMTTRGKNSLECPNRSPLSPIQVDTESAGNEADIDELASSPVISPNRRRKRTKSPNTTPNHKVSAELRTSAEDEATPIATKMTGKPVFNLDSSRYEETTRTNLRTQSISQERNRSRDFDHLAGNDQHDSGISPTLSKSSMQLTNSQNKTLTPNNSANKNGNQSTKIIGYDVSPISSPRSANSPAENSFNSQNSNNGHLLNPSDIATAARKILSSPASSVSNASTTSSKCSATITRTCSTGSLKSVDGNGQLVSRSISRCSNNSEFSHRDGKAMPLKATALRLSWGSTELHTASRKSIQIKNTSSKRLVVRISINGPGFRLVNIDSNILTLQQQECRTIYIDFGPTVLGAAIGHLAFVSPKSKINFVNTIQDSDVCIPLFGYGGHAAVQIKGTLKPSIGLPFVSMGNLHELLQPLKKSIEIRNRGPLTAFAVIDVDSTGLPGLCSAFDFNPEGMLLAADESVNVNVIFRPTRDDFKKIKNCIKDVLVLAKMRIIYGDEPNRQRMRQLVNSMTKVQQTKHLPNSLKKLWQKLPYEDCLPNLEDYVEDANTLQDLLTCISIKEVELTLEYDPFNESVAEISTMFSADSDSTLLFRTVCDPLPSNSPRQLSSVSESLEDDINNETIMIAASSENICYAISSTTPENDSDEESMSWSVSPDIIEFDFEQQSRTSFLIRNNFKSRQYFTVNCNRARTFQFTPAEGYVEPDGGQIEVEVHDNSMRGKENPLRRLSDLFIEVHMESECLKLPVRSKSGNR